MKSVLLGGLKVWLVNDGGKPLSAPGGRAKFYTAGTSTPETVYSDIDLTAADAFGPVVATDKLGYLPAIWLKTDRLYKVVVEQKIQDDPERWNVLWEVDNVGYIDPHESETTGESPITVGTVSALKQVDHEEHTVVLVQGYYNAGDWGEPSMFVYNPDSNAAPDNGAIVRPNDVAPGVSGRWEQVFSGDVIDVRKFGAIPDLSENSDVTAKVVNAVNYSQRNSDRTRPITVGFVAPGRYDFAGSFDFSRYDDFVDLTDNSRHPIKWFINRDVVLKGIAVSASTFTLSKNTICLSTEKLVAGNSGLAVEGGGEIKVDPAWWGMMECTLEDCYVECHSVTTNNKNFTNCTVESNGFLDGYVTLENMSFKERWFFNSYAWSHLVLTDVNYGVRDCLSADSYIDIKNSQLDYNYGDLGEQTVTGKTLHSGCIAENAVFSNVTIQGATELHNVSGSFAVSGSSLALNAVDCWLTALDAFVCTSFIMRRGGIDGNVQVKVLSTLYMDNVDVACWLDTRGASASIEHSRISSNVSSTTIVLKDNDISSQVVQTDVSGVCSVSVIGNRFNGTGSHILNPSTPNTVVNGSWVDNVGNGSITPIGINRTNIDPDETHHDYVYERNSGKHTLQRHYARWTEDIDVLSKGIRWCTTSSSAMYKRTFTFDGHANADGTTDESVYLTTFRFFSVGTQNIRLRLSACPVRNHINSEFSFNPVESTVDDFSFTSTISPVIRAITHVSQFEWKLTRAVYFYELKSELESTFTTYDTSISVGETTFKFTFEVKPV